MTFDAAAAKALFSALTSHAKTLGLFDRVNAHDPDNTPGSGLSCSVTLGPVRRASSGLAATSLEITFVIRLWSSLMQKPLDAVDPAVLAATVTLLGEYGGNFTLAGTVRDVDLDKLAAAPAYLSSEGKEFRVIEITLPIVVNDAFAEVA